MGKTVNCKASVGFSSECTVGGEAGKGKRSLRYTKHDSLITGNNSYINTVNKSF